ncbi:acyl-CoA thioesterase FadM [Filimonas zeae]|uniref:Thioesterase n=1 Tax=Filimonas zeae TaxID=1737353 RepID=A0A917J479_9BACT|nr:thioesterase family protein [Filimonas zeae]MDR6342112.1 acyl-CoA thioesterase FadM [Filimonas zeae]GGH79062.1 thioesterase [Filimonas zeae]
MDRIKLQLPEQFSFTTELSIRITDLNYGGHVGNDVFLSLLHEARMQYLHHHGYTELNMEGAGMIMADVAIEYKQELSFGNTVRISVAAAGFDKLGFDLFYLMELLTPDGTKVAAKAKTGMMCYNYAEKKKMSVPAAAISKLTGGQQVIA